LRPTTISKVYHSLGKFKEAVNSYQAALKIKPDYPEANFGLGVAYLELKDKDAAPEQHKKLAAIDPERADKLYNYITDKKIPLLVLGEPSKMARGKNRNERGAESQRTERQLAFRDQFIRLKHVRRMPPEW
jgi:tetratricopeptide (TPR) repeat protein